MVENVHDMSITFEIQQHNIRFDSSHALEYEKPLME